MYKEIVKVAGEDLCTAKLTTASTTGADAVIAEGTMGSLGVNVFATSDVTIAAGKKCTITVKHADERTGTFSDVTSTVITGATGGSSFKKDTLIGALGLPNDVKKWVKAIVASDDTTNNSGDVLVTLGYLPR